jgi:isopenicillin-N epimerase
MISSLVPTSPVLPAAFVESVPPRMQRRPVEGPCPKFAPLFGLSDSLTFLNHGSYGAVPHESLAYQNALRERIERDPVRFYKVDLEPMLDEVREALGAFLNCRSADLSFVPNATIGLCTVLANTTFAPGDEIVITDHEYQSLPNELERICARSGAKIVTVKVPFPVQDSAAIADAFAAALSPRTKLAFVSHITSCSSLIFPVNAIVKECNSRGIDICVDGAHSPGQIPVDIAAMKPTYFVGSGHKWLSGPKGIGFMYVRSDKQPGFRPLQLSSRANKVRPERALFLRDFDYQGTLDYTHVLTLPTSIAATGRLMFCQGPTEGRRESQAEGWSALMRANHDKIMSARALIAPILEPLGCCVHTAPAHMTPCMTSIIIPDAPPHLENRPTKYDDALQDALYERHNIITPVWRLNATQSRVVRISAQVYNTPQQYRSFALSLAEELSRERGSAT